MATGALAVDDEVWTALAILRCSSVTAGRRRVARSGGDRAEEDEGKDEGLGALDAVGEMMIYSSMYGYSSVETDEIKNDPFRFSLGSVIWKLGGGC